MNTKFQQCVVAVGFLLGAAASATAEDKAGEGEILFATRVYPVLEAKCFACHGTDEENQRRLRSHQSCGFAARRRIG
jgi:mono/diheme cytochrome c family protein